jgi:hypothetical protein
VKQRAGLKFLNFHYRFVQSNSGIQPSLIRHYSLPRDIVEIADGTDHEKMIDFLKLQSSMQNSTS